MTEDVILEHLKRIERQIAHERELRESERRADLLAVDKAFTATKELADKHNDLIRLSERRDQTYARKDEVTRIESELRGNFRRIEAWQSRLAGGFLVLTFIGAANLVKLYAG